MTESDRELLIGYLLESLDADERRQVEGCLARDAQWREELERLRSQLAPLAYDSDVIEPPDGLGESTIELIFAPAPSEQRSAQPAAEDSTGQDSNQIEPTNQDLPSQTLQESGGHRFAGDQGTEESRETDPTAGSRKFDPRRPTDNPRSASSPEPWRFQDCLVLAATALGVVMLLAPALRIARERTHVSCCQSNLRQIGMALTSYSYTHQGLFPGIHKQGPFAVAGAFAPTLIESGFLDNRRWLFCPAAPTQPDEPRLQLSLEEIEQLPPSEWPALQRQFSGSYGGPLGEWANDHYRPSRNRGRTNHAVVSDAPSLHLRYLQSVNHQRRGQNVLFEEGNVRFLKTPKTYDRGDAIFVNHCGYVGPGVSPQDAVIGHSAAPLISTGCKW